MRGHRSLGLLIVLVVTTAANGATAADVAAAVRKAAAVSESAIAPIKLPSLPLSYNEGKSLEQRLTDARKLITSARKYADAIEKAPTALDVYFLTGTVDDLEEKLDQIRRSLLNIGPRNDREGDLVLKLATDVIAAGTDVVVADGEIFDFALAFYENADECLKGRGDNRQLR